MKFLNYILGFTVFIIIVPVVVARLFFVKKALLR